MRGDSNICQLCVSVWTVRRELLALSQSWHRAWPGERHMLAQIKEEEAEAGEHKISWRQSQYPAQSPIAAVASAACHLLHAFLCASRIFYIFFFFSKFNVFIFCAFFKIIFAAGLSPKRHRCWLIKRVGGNSCCGSNCRSSSNSLANLCAHIERES